MWISLNGSESVAIIVSTLEFGIRQCVNRFDSQMYVRIQIWRIEILTDEILMKLKLNAFANALKFSHRNYAVAHFSLVVQIAAHTTTTKILTN